MPNTNQTKPYSIHRNVNIFEHYEMVPHVTKHKDGTETVHDDRLEVTGYNFTGGAFHDTINSVVEAVDDIWDKASKANGYSEESDEDCADFAHVMNTE